MQLVYVGNNKFIIISLYANNKSVRLDKDHPYTFEVTDLLNEDAVKYYESLKSQGVELVKSVNSDVVDDTQDTNDTDSHDEVDTNESDNSDVIDDTQDTNDTDHTEQSDESSDESSSEDTSNSTEDTNSEITDLPSDITQEELIEYLDLNYDDNTIKDLARDAGVKRVQSAWDKMTTINKILETNVNYVANLARS